MTLKPRAGAFSPLVMFAVIAVGVFAFAAFFTLSAFAPELNSGRDGRAHALSQSAVGFAGAVRLARARGRDVYIGRDVADEDRLEGLVLLTPQAPLNPAELGEAAGSSTMVILPKWMVGPDPVRRGWVMSAGTFDEASVASIVSEIAPNLTVTRASGAIRPQIKTAGAGLMTSGPIEDLQTISGAGLSPVVVDEQGRIILAHVQREGMVPFYILSDPDFLNTQGIRNIATARAGMEILDAARQPGDLIIFDVTLNGLGAARSALRLLFEPPFLGATLGLAMATVLLGWRAAARFGPGLHARRVIPLGKAALADNSAALIRLSGRETRMGPGYARVIAVGIAEGFGGGRKDEAESTAWLDRLAASHNVQPSFSTLTAQAASAKSPQEMLEAARKLHEWKQEMKRATR